MLQYGETPLHKAAVFGYDDIIELLVKKGHANINTLSQVLLYFNN